MWAARIGIKKRRNRIFDDGCLERENLGVFVAITWRVLLLTFKTACPGLFRGAAERFVRRDLHWKTFYVSTGCGHGRSDPTQELYRLYFFNTPSFFNRKSCFYFID